MDRKTLLSYSAGHVIVAVYSCIDFFLLPFYTDIIGLAPFLVGTAMAIRFVVDAVTDPLVGFASDHTQSPQGRRRPYFIGGAVASGVLLWLVFSPPTFDSDLAQFWFLTISLVLLFDATSVFQVPHEALAAELTYDYRERIRLSAYRKYFDSVGDMLGLFIVAIVLALTVGDETDSVNTQRTAYSTAAALVAALIIAGGVLAYYGTRGSDHSVARCKYRFLEGMGGAWKNRACFILLSSTVLGLCGIQIAVAQLLYIFMHFYEQPESALPLVLICFFAGSMVAIPFWTRLAMRIGKKQCLSITMLFAAASFIMLVVNRWPVSALYPLAFTIGAGIAGVQGIAMAMWPDVVESDELVTGERREGSYAAMRTFVTKLSLGVALLTVGYVLTWIGYRGGESPTDTTIFRLRFTFAMLPAFCLLAGAAVIRRFPITAETHQDTLEQLGHRRQMPSVDSFRAADVSITD